MVQAAQRAIKNKALSYLSALKDPQVTADLLQRTRSATNMTDQISALACLVDSESESSTHVLAASFRLFHVDICSNCAGFGSEGKNDLVALAGPEREIALAEFYEQWKDDGLVMLKWIALQVNHSHACSQTASALSIKST